MNHTLRRLQRLSMPLGLGLLVAACGTTPPGTSPAPLAPAMGASLNQCAALTGQFRFEQTHIDSAESVAAGGLMLAGQPVAVQSPATSRLSRGESCPGRQRSTPGTALKVAACSVTTRARSSPARAASGKSGRLKRRKP